MELFKKTEIDFIGRRYFASAASMSIVAASLAIILVRGFNYSIEFTGGTLLQVTFQKPQTLGEVRSALEHKGMHPEIQSFADKPTFTLRQKGSEESIQILTDQMAQALQAAFPSNPFTVDRREFVGPVVGRHLKRQTFWAIGLSLLGIVFYITFRFANPIWGLAGLIAMFHDVVGAAGLIALTGKEMDLLIVSALLTVAGYSIEDTIVIYDRMREMLRLMRKEPMDRIINVAINDTLSRTIITVLLVQIICVVLWLFGGSVLHNFALTLVVGNILGTYSSIAVAAPIVYEWEIRKANRGAVRAPAATSGGALPKAASPNPQKLGNPAKTGSVGPGEPPHP